MLWGLERNILTAVGLGKADAVVVDVKDDIQANHRTRAEHYETTVYKPQASDQIKLTHTHQNAMRTPACTLGKVVVGVKRAVRVVVEVLLRRHDKLDLGAVRAVQDDGDVRQVAQARFVDIHRLGAERNARQFQEERLKIRRHRRREERVGRAAIDDDASSAESKTTISIQAQDT